MNLCKSYKFNYSKLYFLHLPFLAFLSYFISQKLKNQPLGKYFLAGLILKFLAGIALGILYLFHYQQGDSLYFFEQGAKLSTFINSEPANYFHFLFHDPRESFYHLRIEMIDITPRTVFMVKIVSIFAYFCGQNYWLISLYFSFFAFIGLWICANSLAKILPHQNSIFAFAFLFFPSVVFWSSGILKESLLWFLLGISIHILLVFDWKKVFHWLALLVCAFFMLKLKYYYLAVLLAVAIPYQILFFLQKRINFTAFSLVLTYFFLFVLMLFCASFLHPNLNADRFLAAVIQNHDQIIAVSKPENSIFFDHLSANFMSFLQNIPTAFVAVFFRPFIWETENIFKILASLENIALFLMFLGIRKSIFPKKNNLLLLSAIFYIFLLAILLAFSTPNIGTLVRYKVGFMPFLVYLLLCRSRFFYFFNKEKV